MITSTEIFDHNETTEDVHEFVSSIFSIEENITLDPSLYPTKRLGKLKEIREKVEKESLDEGEIKELYSNIVEEVNKSYLLKIFQDLLDLDIYEYDFNGSIKNNVLYLLQKNTSYLDAILVNPPLKLDHNLSFNKQLKDIFKNKNEFNYTFTDSDRNYTNKRNLLIKECFNGNKKKYLEFFKEKLLSTSHVIWKHLLLVELQKLSTKEINQSLEYLMQTHIHCSYTNKDNEQTKKAKLFFNSNHWGDLLIKNQKSFYLSLQLIFNKINEPDFTEDKLTEYNKDIIQTLIWLKSSQKESISVLETLAELNEREKVFALNNPNNLILHIYDLKDKLNKELSLRRKQQYIRDISNSSARNEFASTKNLCDSITEKVILICKEILEDERNLIRKELRIERNSTVIKLLKKLTHTTIIVSLIGVVWFGCYYFFDIESIYKNSFQKDAKSTMESTPYFTELKDSLNPADNETNQRLRLDHINDLNSRYFKVISLFLNPELTDEEINKSLPSLNISKAIKDISSIKVIRNHLSKVFNKEDWELNIEPILGPNVLTELRAYGAISNFLVPSLAHYAILDNNGRPLKINGKIQIFTPPSEKETLSKSLIAKFGTVSNKAFTEPKYYIDNFDVNYINIKNTSELLLSKTTSLKKEIINQYQKASSEEKIKLKKVLHGIALTEIRLLDLKSKIQLRHNYIVKNNTYRAPLE